MGKQQVIILLLCLSFILGLTYCSSSVSREDDPRKPIYLDSKKQNNQRKEQNDKRPRKRSSYKEKQGTSTEKPSRKPEGKDAGRGAKLVTLKDLLDYALRHSPALRSAEKRVEGFLYAEEQSDKTFQLNPSFRGFIGRHNKPAPASNGLRYELLVNQPFEVGGQQGARRKIGKYRRKQSEDQLFALKMRILSRVKFLYYKELILRKKWKAINEVKRFFDKILWVTKAKRDERQISDPKALLVIILYNSFMNDYDNVKEELDNNLEELKAVIYYQGDREINLKGTIRHKFISFSDEELNQIAKKSRLELLIRYRSLQIKEGQIDMEKSKVFPRVSVFLRHRRDINDKIYDVGISFPIPLLNTNSGNIDARKYEKKAIESEINGLLLDIRQEIRIALRRMKIALIKIKRYRKSILRDTKTTTRLIREFYTLGGAEFNQLLQQEKIYQQMILAYWSAVQDYYKSIFDIEIAIGRAIFESKSYLNRNRKRFQDKKSPKKSIDK